MAYIKYGREKNKCFSPDHPCPDTSAEPDFTWLCRVCAVSLSWPLAE
jgi:hypothetical protein